MSTPSDALRTPYTIVNGAAGGGRCRSRFDQAHEKLLELGLRPKVHLTEGPGHARELARDAWQRGERVFLAVGGDGTLFEVVDGLLVESVEEPPVVGVLPLGTGNSFLRDFDITSETDALLALARGRTRTCDALRLEHQAGVHHFVNIFAVGFAAEAGDLTNRRFKRLGPVGYALAVAATVARLGPRFDPIRLDEGPLDVAPRTFLSVCNSRYTGGKMMMAPQADPSDGLLDVVRCGPMKRSELLAAFPRIFKGTHLDLPSIDYRQAHGVRFEQPRQQPVMLDGEVSRLAPCRIEVVPGCWKVIA